MFKLRRNHIGTDGRIIDQLKVDWTKDPPEVSLPAIVPPLAMKPVICTLSDRLVPLGQHQEGQDDFHHWLLLRRGG